MAKVKDCPGFETFGKDVKNARLEMRISRQKLAETLHISQVYLANIENDDSIPSLPIIIQLIKICGLPVERYFNPIIMCDASEQRQRVSHKVKLCPEEYLSIIEGALDGAIANK
ncbi:MAG: helix-turn-helix domain-containing protein [Oscillospiraceae bacterium]|nr:helix-turn-helix domain-containing protein [Oscillospiraceae bacterium]